MVMVIRSIRRICVLCVAAAIAAGFGTVGAASAKRAKKSHVASQVFFRSIGANGISGRVSAQGKKGKPCRGQRQVVIYRVNSQDSVPSSQPVAITWTGGDGGWTLAGPQNPGMYWAQVYKRTVKTKKKGKKRTVICGGAFSDGGATWPTGPG